MDFDITDTPLVLINNQQVKTNIAAFQRHCDRLGVAVRPHIKTHKLPQLAHWQLAAGAVGITCQKISEAEVMADAGVRDILLSFNILGKQKLDRLKQLHGRIDNLILVADNEQVVDGLAATFVESDPPVKVLVECDTGAQRCGVQSTEQAVQLAQYIDAKQGLAFAGLMTYPPNSPIDAVGQRLQAIIDALLAVSLACQIVSSGGTPEMLLASQLPMLTEYRPGTYIYNDRSLVRYGSCSYADCALHVVATVISTPAPGRAIIDAGSKVLSSDLLGMHDYGYVLNHDDVSIYALSEEHGHLRWQGEEPRFSVGEQIRIIPNHACVVSNLVGKVWLTQADSCDLEIVAAQSCVV